MTEEQPVVFVVDDDGMVRDAVEDLLRSVGLSVESFGSAQDFLQSKRSDAPGSSYSTSDCQERAGWHFSGPWSNWASRFQSYSLAVTATSPCPCGQ